MLGNHLHIISNNNIRNFLFNSCSLFVSYYWFGRRVYHGSVVDRRKVAINQVKFIFT